MLINQSTLDGVFTSLNAIFNAAFAGVEPTHEQIAMVVPSNTRTNDYKFMLQFPMLQEWIGDRVLKSLASENFTITNKDYEASVEVDRNDIEDDQIGIYNPIVGELGRAAAQHPSILLATLIACRVRHDLLRRRVFLRHRPPGRHQHPEQLRRRRRHGLVSVGHFPGDPAVHLPAPHDPAVGAAGQDGRRERLHAEEIPLRRGLSGRGGFRPLAVGLRLQRHPERIQPAGRYRGHERAIPTTKG